jgi:hypothetical protein
MTPSISVVTIVISRAAMRLRVMFIRLSGGPSNDRP